jgi:hypothetical protein
MAAIRLHIRCGDKYEQSRLFSIGAEETYVNRPYKSAVFAQQPIELRAYQI